MIKKITLGPRSRVLEAQEANARDVGDRVLGGLLPPTQPEIVEGRPPSGLRGCACGKVHIPHSDDPDEQVELDGVRHRYSRPCYSLDADGTRIYSDFRKGADLGSRVANLERVVADLVARMGP